MSGNFTLEVKVLSYQNMLHQAVGNNGDCCDNEAADNPLSAAGCTDPCDNFFVFCLRDYNAPEDHDGLVDLTDCPRSNRAQIGVLEDNNDNLIFTLGQPFSQSFNHSLVPNPVQLSGFNWNVSVSLEYI